MARPVRTFDIDKTEDNQEVIARKPLVQLEPSCFYEDEIDLENHSSIPQGVELKREVPKEENNVELSDLERKLQKVGIIPSDDWISGKSKNLWVNLFKNIVTETLGITKEEELVESDYIIELPQDNLAKVEDLEPKYSEPVENTKTCDASKTTVIDINYDLFYSDTDESELDAAPSVCEIYK